MYLYAKHFTDDGGVGGWVFYVENEISMNENEMRFGKLRHYIIQ